MNEVHDDVGGVVVLIPSSEQFIDVKSSIQVGLRNNLVYFGLDTKSSDYNEKQIYCLACC